jgi:hypothetical protein
MRLALALGRSVKELLNTVDSEEIAEWFAFDQMYPLPNAWLQTARICRTIMAASGNFKRVPDEDVFIPSVRKKPQTQEQMMQELAKLMAPPQG